MTTEQFYDGIEADRDAINDAAYSGDEKALLVIKIYRMHFARPSDPGALGLCIAAYEDWRKEYLSPKPANALKRKGE